MLALLFFALALPAVLVAFALGAALAYRRGRRAGRRDMTRVFHRMLDDEAYAAEVMAAGRLVLDGKAGPQ